MRFAAGIVLSCAACALAGCGSSASDQVRAKIAQFVRAADAKDYATICNQVLAPSLVQRLSSAGVRCPQAMEIALGGVQDPTLSVGQVKVAGTKATAITLSVARGQRPSLDTVDLIKTAHGWRVSSLASPLTANNLK